jgi:hypothetical protein
MSRIQIPDFRRRYRQSLAVLVFGWLVALPFLAFNQWLVPTMYQRYVARVTAAKPSGSTEHSTATKPLGELGAVIPDDQIESVTPIAVGPLRAEAFDPLSADGSPLALDEWKSATVGHPTYYYILRWLSPWSLGMAVVCSLPWLWYFILLRLAELCSVFTGADQ